MLQKILNLLQNNQLAEARTLCEQATRSNKKNPGIWLLLAEIYQQSGAFEKAENSCRKAIKLKNDHAPAHTQLAMLYHTQGKLPRAEHCYHRSLKLDNTQATVYFNLGAVLQELNKPDEAITQYQLAIKLKPDYAKAYANMGYLLRQQEKIEDAINHYDKALQFAPNIAELHYNMGSTLLQTGRPEEAEKHQREALKLKPNYADALSGLGAVQFFNGETEKSAYSYQQALNHQPDNVEILRGFANVLSSLGHHETAIEHITHALDIDPNNKDTRIAKGFIYLSCGQLDEAFDCCYPILNTKSPHKKSIYLAASVYEKKGDAKKSYQYLAPLLEENPPPVEAVLNFSYISNSLNLVDKAIEYMEQLLQNDKISIPADNRRRLYFALGKAYDRQKNYNSAIKNFYTANKLKQAVFDIKTIQRDVDAQINIFPSNFKNHLATTSIRSQRPIFIVGMPRSGTSLVEQILASHPKICGAGELSDINNLAQRMQLTNKLESRYPKCLEQADSQQLNHMTQTYLNRLSDIDNKALHVTDKMPGNFMHLGLIQLLFPDARIIHCIRNPLDTCLSCYFQDFSVNHPWIYDLENTGKFYLEYKRLMKHWKNVLDIPILDVNYEELVENQETVSRQMIKFFDLDWDDACLQFHKNKRFIWTASYQQVCQPIYKKSVSRWKNYEQHIKPLINILK